VAQTLNKTALSNIPGRVVYLQTTVSYWPELIRSLPWHNWQRAHPNARPETFREMETAAGFEQNCAALEKWARKNEIKDLWIWDAAVQTLMNSPPGSMPTVWLYVSPEFPVEPLSLILGHWIPELLPWSQFKKAVTKHFGEKLKMYRRSRVELWGSTRTSLAPQAKWTVLWQRGKTAGQIRSHLPRLHSREVSPDGIAMGIRSFASSIGLTLREGRSGPSRRT
jgi:hypothetical protein